jgi:hypothetical protein
MYIIGVLGLLAFVFQEIKMGDEALLPMRLFRRQTFALGNTLNFIMGLGMFGGMMSLPLYLQIVKGATPTQSGLLSLPMTFGIMTAAMSSGVITSKTGRYKIFPVIGLAGVTAALLLFATIGVDTATWKTMLIMVLMGAGLGLCMQTLILAIQNDVPVKDMGVATSSATFFRSIGGTVGTAVFLSILFSTVGSRIGNAFSSARTDPAFLSALQANPQFAQNLQGGGGGLDLNNTEFLKTLDPTLARPILVGFSSAIDTVFITGAAVMAVAFVLIWFLKEKPLSMMSGIQRQAAEDAGADTVPAAMH